MLLLALAALNPSWNWYGEVVICGEADRPQVALTFDDGPDPKYTREVLSALEAGGARATFFMVGEKVRLYPELVREVYERGHQVAHHSQSHDWRVMLSPALATEDLAGGAAAFSHVLGRRPRFFRPPIGLVTPDLLGAVREAGMVALLWSVRTFDGRPVTPQRLVKRVLDGLGPGDVVLLHDVSPAAAPEQAPAAIEALPAILDGLERKGITAVTVSELLGEPAYLDDSDHRDEGAVPRRGVLAKAVAATFALLVLATAASAFANPPLVMSDGTQEAKVDFPASFVAAAGMLSEHATVQARFTQSKSSQLFVDEVVQRGLLQLRRRDQRLLWSYDEGARLLLADGQFYSLGAPDAARGARRLPPPAARMAEMMGALFFLRLEVLVEHFEVAAAGEGLFVLHPRRTAPKAAFRAVRLQLGGEPLVLRRVVLEEKGGDVTRIEFTDVQLGVELPDGLFRSPGEGTEAP